jgi:hypothetical protein
MLSEPVLVAEAEPTRRASRARFCALLLAVAALGPLTATKRAEEVTPSSRSEADRAASPTMSVS